jgi:hypothetical protein
MNYRGLVQKYVSKVFKDIGTLATDVGFITRNDSVFNFNTGIISGFPSENAHRVFVEDTDNEDRNVLVKHILANRNDIPDIRLFSSVRIDGVLWKIGKLISHNDYVIKFEVFREVL